VSRAAAALAALTVLRLAVCAATPLAPDEAYYWVWSRALAPGYLDHPPMVAVWIRIGTLIAEPTALGVRLLGPLSAALGTWMLADAAERLLPGRQAGLIAGCMLNATLFLAVGSVVMTPDSPLIFFWTATIWALVRLVQGGRSRWWWAVGLFAGLALLSKYTAVLLWAGIGLWLLITPSMRRWLLHPAPWLAGLFGALLFVPVLLWNQAHGWAGFLRQGGRIGEWQVGRAAHYLGELIGSQAGLATPGVWVLCLGGIVLAIRQGWKTRDPGWSLLACLTVPAALVFLQHATGDRVQGNWPAIIYPAASIAAAGLVMPVWRALRWPSVALGGVIGGLVYVQGITGALPIPARLDPIELRMAGWDALAQQVEAARGMAGAGYVVADQYALASALAWTLPPSTTVLGAEDRWVLFALDRAPVEDEAGLLVRDVRDGEAFDDTLWRAATPVGSAERPGRDGAVQRFRLVRVVAAAGDGRVVRLPRPGSSADR
jgi:4-amino-4-deoxy-L-arabinose transferase-like glycosyltransferase